MRVIGIDPPQGYAVLDAFSAEDVHHVACGTFRNNPAADLVEVMREYCVERVGIERIEHVEGRPFGMSVQYADALYHTGVARGEMRAASRYVFSLPPIEPTEREWREWLLGYARPPKGCESTIDQLVAVAIPRRIKGWPKVSNKHARDAAGVALHVALGMLR